MNVIRIDNEYNIKITTEIVKHNTLNSEKRSKNIKKLIKK